MLDIIDIPGIPRGADVGMKLNRLILYFLSWELYPGYIDIWN